MTATQEQISAMKARLKKRQDDRRADAEIDQVIQLVYSKHQVHQKPAVAVDPISASMQFINSNGVRRADSNWKETALMVAVSILLIAGSLAAI